MVPNTSRIVGQIWIYKKKKKPFEYASMGVYIYSQSKGGRPAVNLSGRAFNVAGCLQTPQADHAQLLVVNYLSSILQ